MNTAFLNLSDFFKVGVMALLFMMAFRYLTKKLRPQ